MATRFKCVVCGKLTAGRKPKASWEPGDTTARFPRRHDVDGKPCSGNIEEAEWVSDGDDGLP